MEKGFKRGDIVRIYSNCKTDVERGEDTNEEDVPLLFYRFGEGTKDSDKIPVLSLLL